jgi:nitroreductase
MQDWHFVVVTDSDKKAALAELYRKGQEASLKLPLPNSMTQNVMQLKKELFPQQGT